MEPYMLWIWLFIFVLAVVVEAVTQDLVSIWFSIAALVTLCICNTIPYYIEIVIFCIISLITLILTRPFVKKIMDRAIRYTNVDEIIGKRVVLLKKVTRFDLGEAKVNGIIYNVSLPEDVNYEIEKDEIVEIVAIKGNRVIVREISKEND